MKKIFWLCFLVIFWSLPSYSAVLHFYSNPRVPQTWFHIALEYQSYYYEADPREGGHRLPIAAIAKKGDQQIEISDNLVNEEALLSQMGLPFDYEFIWDNGKTYCSELVGLALNIPPKPMDFSGTHYVKHYPHWIHRKDPGLSPDQIYEFGLQHGTMVYLR